MEGTSLFARIPFFEILAGIAFFAFWVYAFFILYHLLRFGVGPRPKTLGLAFFLGAVILFMIAVGFFIRVEPPAFLQGFYLL